MSKQFRTPLDVEAIRARYLKMGAKAALAELAVSHHLHLLYHREEEDRRRKDLRFWSPILISIAAIVLASVQAVHGWFP